MSQRRVRASLRTAFVVIAACLVTSCAPVGDAETTTGPADPAGSADRAGSEALVAPDTALRAAVRSASVTAPPNPTSSAPDHLADPAPPAAPPTTIIVLEATSAPAPTGPSDTVSSDTVPSDPATTEPPPTEVPPTTVPPTTVPPTTVPPTTVPPTTTTAAPIDSGGVAAAFVADINALRAANGAGALSRDGALDAMAQSWAERMAADDWLRHSDLIHEVVGQGWMAAGENIAYGPDEPSMFAGLRNSAGHLANMVNPAYTHVGIGVTVVGSVVWTAHLFAG